MKPIKPTLENLGADFGSTIMVKEFVYPYQNNYQYWHFHHEYELIYINSGPGKRYIGSHISYFSNGELILIGPRLPHYSFTEPFTPEQMKTSIQMKENFAGEAFFLLPEMTAMKQLFEKAKKGISFHGLTKKNVGKKIEKLMLFDGFERILKVLEILNDLALSDEYTVLNAQGFLIEVSPQDNDRLNSIYNFIRENFKRSLSLTEVAGQASMTVPSFARYFKKMTGKTFTQFVNEYRLVHASKLLAEKPTSITDICFESGFNNFSHFNKLFKQFTGKNPSEYRKELRQIVV